MSVPPTAPKRIAIVAHPQLAESLSTSMEMAALLEKEGIYVRHGLLYEPDLRQEISDL